MLSRSRVLSRFWDLKDTIVQFLNEIEKLLEERACLQIDQWLNDLAFVVDIITLPKIQDFVLEEEGQVDSDERGPNLLTAEIHAAIAEMKNRKAVGPDDIPAEFLKLLEERTLVKLAELCNEIYEKGIWPKDLCRILMIPISKKCNETECAEYRTIRLVSHA